jgi:LPPG:FO 2-phospho-L-lactate transferase
MLDATERELVVIANTGDDIEIYGAHVSPDPDLISFWLADRIDSRGWGIDGDTFNVMDGLRELGQEIWFNLGDEDLAIGIERARALRNGRRLTEFHAQLTDRLQITRARVLPMSDQPVRTRILAGGRSWTLQEFLIQGRGPDGWPPVQDVQFRGAAGAQTTPEVLDAITGASAIVIGPSNPIISIGPILAVPGVAEALKAAAAPVVAVSPLVGGHVIKGPTADFMRWHGVPVTAAGLAMIYGDRLDGLVCDEPLSGEARLSTFQADLLMNDAPARVRLAAATLTFAAEISATK